MEIKKVLLLAMWALAALRVGSAAGRQSVFLEV
jgi:hypothetical protein